MKLNEAIVMFSWLFYTVDQGRVLGAEDCCCCGGERGWAGMRRVQLPGAQVCDTLASLMFRGSSGPRAVVILLVSGARRLSGASLPSPVPHQDARSPYQPFACISKKKKIKKKKLIMQKTQAPVLSECVVRRRDVAQVAAQAHGLCKWSEH